MQILITWLVGVVGLQAVAGLVYFIGIAYSWARGHVRRTDSERLVPAGWGVAVFAMLLVVFTMTSGVYAFGAFLQTLFS